MSDAASPLEERLRLLADQARGEAEAEERKLPELVALARAGAVLAKRVPDKLIDAARRSASDGSLEALLRARLGDDADLSKLTPVVAALLVQQAEACGEELLSVTDASVRSGAAVKARAGTLREQADRMAALLAPPVPEEHAAGGGGPPAAPEVPGEQGGPAERGGERPGEAR